MSAHGPSIDITRSTRNGVSGGAGHGAMGGVPGETLPVGAFAELFRTASGPQRADRSMSDESGSMPTTPSEASDATVQAGSVESSGQAGQGDHSGGAGTDESARTIQARRGNAGNASWRDVDPSTGAASIGLPGAGEGAAAQGLVRPDQLDPTGSSATGAATPAGTATSASVPGASHAASARENALPMSAQAAARSTDPGTAPSSVSADDGARLSAAAAPSSLANGAQPGAQAQDTTLSNGAAPASARPSQAATPGAVSTSATTDAATRSATAANAVTGAATGAATTAATGAASVAMSATAASAAMIRSASATSTEAPASLPARRAKPSTSAGLIDGSRPSRDTVSASPAGAVMPGLRTADGQPYATSLPQAVPTRSDVAVSVAAGASLTGADKPASAVVGTNSAAMDPATLQAATDQTHARRIRTDAIPAAAPATMLPGQLQALSRAGIAAPAVRLSGTPASRSGGAASQVPGSVAAAHLLGGTSDSSRPTGEPGGTGVDRPVAMPLIASGEELARRAAIATDAAMAARTTGSSPGSPGAGERDGGVPASLISAGATAQVGPTGSVAPMPGTTAPTGQHGLALMNADAPQVIGDTIRLTLAQGQQSARIDLSPVELGSMTVELEQRDGRLAVSLHSPVGTTRDLVESMIPRLREQLANDGHASVSVDVGDRGEDGERRGARPGPFTLADGDRNTADARGNGERAAGERASGERANGDRAAGERGRDGERGRADDRSGTTDASSSDRARSPEPSSLGPHRVLDAWI